MEQLTFEMVMEKNNEIGDIHKVIKWAECFRPNEYPDKPKKPQAPTLPSSQFPTVTLILFHAVELEVYAKDIREWGTAMKTYHEQWNLANEQEREVTDIIVKYIKEISGFNGLNLPESKKQKVWDKAWEDGHSDGYYNVYQELCDLLELLD